MIGYLEGRIIHSYPEGILLLAGGVGYEVLLSPITLSHIMKESSAGVDATGSLSGNGTALGAKPAKKTLARLYIYYHVTERQPKPVLIGFSTLEEKSFFQLFITVAAIGPMKAIKALTKPVGEVAAAIEQKDIALLSKLPGIGKRTAEKIVATLRGKATPFAVQTSLTPQTPEAAPTPVASDKKDITQQVTDVLVDQLGHSVTSARRMIREAFNQNPDIDSPEALFDAIYQENS